MTTYKIVEYIRTITFIAVLIILFIYYKQTDDIVFINSKQEEVRFTDKSSKYKIFYFGFTKCPDVCPKALKKLNTAINNCKKKHSDLKNIKTYFSSIDISRDTIHDITKFTSEYKNIEGILLTDPITTLPKLEKKLGIYNQKIAPSNCKDKSQYSINHSSIIYILNNKGIVIQAMPSSLDLDKITDEILKILK